MKKSLRIMSAIIILLMMVAIVVPANAGWLGRKHWFFQIIDARTGEPAIGSSTGRGWGTYIKVPGTVTNAKVYATETTATPSSKQFATPNSNGMFEFWAGRSSLDIYVYNTTNWQRYQGKLVNDHILIFGSVGYTGMIPQATPILSSPGEMFLKNNAIPEVFIAVGTLDDPSTSWVNITD